MRRGARDRHRGAVVLGVVALVGAGVLVGGALVGGALDRAGPSDPSVSVRYPDDLPVEAPRLNGVLLSSTAGDGIWSLRYSRRGLTPDAALADLATRGYTEEFRSRDENDVVRVSLVGSSPFLLALSWSDDDDQSPIDLVLRSPERRGIP